MNIIIAYGSTTGNTAKIASYLADAFRKEGHEVSVKAIADIKPRDVLAYDLILLGSSTWGVGSLQEYARSFFMEMSDLNLEGKKAGAFGAGDVYSYPRSFCKAVDVLQKKLKDCGAMIVQPGLKISGDVEAAKESAAEWAERAMNVINA